MTTWAEGRRDEDMTWRWVRSQAELVPCPRCEEPVGSTCRNPATAEVFKRAPAHWQRIKAAEQVEAP